MLIVELDGPQVEVDELFAVVERVCQECGRQRRSRSRATQAQRERIWKGRKAAFAAMGRVSPNYYVQDGVVPAHEAARGAAAHSRARGAIGPADRQRLSCRRRQPASADLLRRDDSRAGGARRSRSRRRSCTYCIEAGGAITGEHGVGADKKAYMPKMFARGRSRRDAAACAARSIRRTSAIRARFSRRRVSAARCRARTAQHPARARRSGGALLMMRVADPRTADAAAAAAMLAERGRRQVVITPRRSARRQLGRTRACGCGRAYSVDAQADTRRSITTPATRRHRAGRRDARRRQCRRWAASGNGCRSIRRTAIARRSAASSRPTTAVRGAIATARRAI